MTKMNQTTERINYKAKDFFGSLVPQRSCGDCTVCCVELKIETAEISKEPGLPCEYKTEKGCGIYNDRFPICHSFHCLWRYIEAMPDEARPDRLGIMFGLAQPNKPENIFHSCYIHALAFDDSAALEAKLAIQQLDMLAQGQLPIWASIPNHSLYLIHPKEEIVAAVMQPTDNHSWVSLIAAKQWSTGLRKKTIGWKQLLRKVFSKNDP